MHRIEWDEKLATRHARMDRDHKKLVDLVNQLAEAISAGKGKFVRCTIFDEIVRHTRAHFAVEEELMDAHHFPEAEEHRAEHFSLVKQLVQHKLWVEEGSENISTSLLHFLEFWLTHHIRTSDQTLALFLNSASESHPPSPSHKHHPKKHL